MIMYPFHSRECNFKKIPELRKKKKRNNSARGMQSTHTHTHIAHLCMNKRQEKSDKTSSFPEKLLNSFEEKERKKGRGRGEKKNHNQVIKGCLNLAHNKQTWTKNNKYKWRERERRKAFPNDLIIKPREDERARVLYTYREAIKFRVVNCVGAFFWSFYHQALFLAGRKLQFLTARRRCSTHRRGL